MYLKKAVTSLIAAALLISCGCGGGAERAAHMAARTELPTEQQETMAAVPPSPENSVPANDPDSIVITDMSGREIRLDVMPERVIALSPAGCEMLYALGAERSLIGRGECCDYPPEAMDIPVFSMGDEEDASGIVSQRPDMLILNAMDLQAEQIVRLEQAGIPILVCDAETLEENYACLRMLGQVFDKQKPAEQIIQGMQDAFAAIQADPVPGGRTIYFERETESGLYTAGRGTFLNDIAELMGLQNCFGDLDGWTLVDEDQVAERDPDFILTVTPFSGEGVAPEDEIVCRDAWQDMAAVMNEDVIGMPDNELSRIGPRLAFGAQMLYDFVVESLAAQE